MTDRMRWFAIKAEIRDLAATSFAFAAQNTMYGGKSIAVGDPNFIFTKPKGEGQSRNPQTQSACHKSFTNGV